MRQTADFSGLFTSHLISGPEVTRDLGSDVKYHDLQQNIRSADENWEPNDLVRLTIQNNADKHDKYS